MSNYSTVNPNKVMFSAGSRVMVGAPDAAKGACTPVGLLGADITLGVEKTFRTKNDHFPEVEVASAVQSLSATVNMVLREWTKQNLMFALDVNAGQVTDVPASAVNVVDEAYKMPATGQLAVTIPHVGLTNIGVDDDQGSPHTINTDYVVVETPTATMIVATSGGGISASDDLLISYDYTPLAHSIMPFGASGPRNYYGMWIEEGFTASQTARVDFQIYRCAIGLDGSFNLNNAEQGGDLPVLVQASLLPGKTELGRVYNYE